MSQPFLKGAEKVRNHPEWSKEEKPWGLFPAKSLMGSMESHFIYRTVKSLGSGNYANLGVYRGVSVACMAWGLKFLKNEGTVYAVDNWRYNENHYDEVNKNLKLTELDSYVKICSGTTNEWADKLKDVRFKFIFVDAGHKYEEARDDFLNWSPLLTDDGIIAFHDIVTQEVDAVLTDFVEPNYELVDHVWNIKAFKKNDIR